jgi:Glycosyl hydrolases family 28
MPPFRAWLRIGVFLAVVTSLTERTTTAAEMAEGNVRIYPAPDGEILSEKFAVTVDGRSTPVYVAKVAPADPGQRFKAMDDKLNSARYFAEAAFVTFDLRASTRVEIVCRGPTAIQQACVLPASRGIVPVVRGNRVSFELTGPEQLTLEINGDWVGCLHLFANPWEETAPHADDPRVMYFGPGIHEVDNVVVRSGQTVYLAGGAIVRARPKAEAKGGTAFLLEGDNIVFRGRGILDGSLCPTLSRHLIKVQGGRHILLEGVVLRDPSVWAVPIRRSEDVTVRNLKIIGYRANSDGIDLCNSRRVDVTGCFIRTLDDLIVVKTDRGQGPAGQINVERCVLWNEVAHALSIGAELREPVSDVRFADCDIIHDRGREWTLRVFQSDAARVSNVRFENLRIAESRQLISLWIGSAVWSRDLERGRIADVVFENIAAAEGPAAIKLQGFDADHAVERVTFRNVRRGGQPLQPADVNRNAFVQDVTVAP